MSEDSEERIKRMNLKSNKEKVIAKQTRKKRTNLKISCTLSGTPLHIFQSENCLNTECPKP